MISNLGIDHPWFYKKIKTRIWNLLRWLNISTIVYSLGNQNLKIKIRTDNSIGKGIFFENYEKSTFLFIEKYIKRGDIVIDVGANIGVFSLAFSNLVGDSGYVHSFEPSQREFIALSENIKLNDLKNVYLNQLALSNENGFFEMYVLSDEGFGAYNSFNKITHPSARLHDFQVQTVRAITLDSYLALFPSSVPKLIKIDVEGFEKQVLEGMAKLLCNENSPCLIIEMCEVTHQGTQKSIQELVQYVESYGYHLYGANCQGNLGSFEIGNSLNAIALKETQFSYAISNGVEIAGIS